MKFANTTSALVLLSVVALVGCGHKRPPTAAVPGQPPATPAAFPSSAPPPSPGAPPTAPARVANDAPITSSPLTSWDAQPLDVINGPDSPLKPVFFSLDSDQLDDTAKKTVTADAEVMKTYKTWVVTIEGHCDERGSAEYNLALGDRRALATKAYLVSLGIEPERVRTVSYGNEFPFDPAHTESAWALNRRAHFMLTSK